MLAFTQIVAALSSRLYGHQRLENGPIRSQIAEFDRRRFRQYSAAGSPVLVEHPSASPDTEQEPTPIASVERNHTTKSDNACRARRHENVEGHQARRSSAKLTKRQHQPTATFERFRDLNPRPANDEEGLKRLLRSVPHRAAVIGSAESMSTMSTSAR
jgi:hypothetical protein